MNVEQLRQRATISLWPDAGQLLGISKNTAYAAAKRGEIPTLRFGQRYVVPVPALLRMLSLEPTD